MQFSTVIGLYTLPNSGARLTQCCKLTIVQIETTIKQQSSTLFNIRRNLKAVNIYKQAFTFWHRSRIEPGDPSIPSRTLYYYSTALFSTNPIR